MADKRVFKLVHTQARRLAVETVQTAPDGYCVTVSEPARSLEQNAAQWPYLAGFAQQKQLCINGVMQYVTDDDWKDVLTACWNGEMRMAVAQLATCDAVVMLPGWSKSKGACIEHQLAVGLGLEIMEAGAC